MGKQHDSLAGDKEGGKASKTDLKAELGQHPENVKEQGSHKAPEEHKKKKKKRKRASDERPAIAAPAANGGAPPVHKERGLQDDRKKDATQQKERLPGAVPQPQIAVGKSAGAAGEKGGAVNKPSEKGEPPEGFSEKKRKKKRESDAPAEQGGARPADDIGVVVLSPFGGMGNRPGFQDKVEGVNASLPLDANVLKEPDVEMGADVDMGADLDENADVDMGANGDMGADKDGAADVTKGNDVFAFEPESEARPQFDEQKSGGKKKPVKKAKAEKDLPVTNAGPKTGERRPGVAHAQSAKSAYDAWGRYFEAKWQGSRVPSIPRATGLAKGQPSGVGKVRQSEGTAKEPVNPPELREEVEETGGEPGVTGAASQFTLRQGPLPCQIDGCHSSARFGTKADGHPLVPDTCVKHKLPSMTECKSAICEVAGCFHKVVYRVPGRKRTRCSTHKEEGMVTK